MRYAVVGLAVLVVVAAGLAYETRDPSRTEVPAIELRTDEVSEPESTKRVGPKEKRKEESAQRRTRSGRGAAPAPGQAPVPAGDDDGDDGDD
jgi:hypothetical protein